VLDFQHTAGFAATAQSDMESLNRLSKRERQVMDVLYQLRAATVGDIVDHFPEATTYSAIRATLRSLGEKSEVTFKQDGPRYVYLPRVAQEKAATAAATHLVGTFFNGSVEAAVMTLLKMSDAKLSKGEIARLRAKIRDADREGR
jgi:predicted transcriptional regulator